MELKPFSASLLGIGKLRPISDSLSPFGCIPCCFFLSVNGIEKKNILVIFYQKNFVRFFFFNFQKIRYFQNKIKEKNGVFFFPLSGSFWRKIDASGRKPTKSESVTP